jgi:hypothetical protein
VTTAASVLITAALSMVLAMREPVVQIVYVENPQRSSAQAEQRQASAADQVAARQIAIAQSRMIAHAAGSGHDYLSLRERILSSGIDALPESVTSPSHDETPAISDSRYGALIGELRGG